MPDLRISLVQTSIVWENKKENLSIYEGKIKQLAGNTDLVVFPEMFTTGFNMDSALLAESNDGETISLIKKWAKTYDFAIAGSFIACENENYFNRGFIILPSGESFFYDKRHLFAFGGETESFSSGSKRLIVNYKEWNICLLICYDLRFPVWSRNIDNEYDVLIYVASWPESRQLVWDTLLKSRAIENQCYVCGVNRVGKDNMSLIYAGGSALINAKGNVLSNIPMHADCIETLSINKDELDIFRQKFPAWRDTDNFTIL